MFSYSTLDGLVAGAAATATLFCASPRPEQVVLISIRWPDTPYSCDHNCWYTFYVIYCVYYGLQPVLWARGSVPHM